MKITITNIVEDMTKKTEVEGNMYECMSIWANLLAIEGIISHETFNKIISNLKEKGE
jgi:hypothetical protein